jgi:hypothetical protein
MRLQGLAAWVAQWSKMPVPTLIPSVQPSKPPALSDETNAEVINVLVAMALGHLQEVHV